MFKFRAECYPDVESLLDLIPKEEIMHRSIKPLELGLPDVVVAISFKTLDLETLKDLIRKVEDGHVMLQTIEPLESYTGERDYSRV